MRILILAGLLSHAAVGADYHVDCFAGNDSASGLTPQSAWRSLAKANHQALQPGDSLLLKRGTTCSGMLAPRGSGNAAAPIVLSAWGTGPLPKVQAEAAEKAALKLFNQEYWRVENIEFIGGNPHGVLVSGDRGVLHSIHLTNLIAHDVTGKPSTKEHGIIAIVAGSLEQRFDDVLLDGITAYRTSQWAGIIVGGVRFGALPEQKRSTKVIVRNSIVHDVQGDGIILFQVNHGRIENSVAWHTGMQETEHMGTPNAIWSWMCRDCTIERNEAFLVDSPGIDGGAFDIDYASADTVVEQNYGHDTQGYCVAVFGAAGITKNSVVRNNICVDNGLSPRLARRQGAIFLSTWNKGKLQGVQIERNRVYWNPPIAAAALVNRAELIGQGSFEGNTIRSSAAEMVESNPSLVLKENNLEYAAGRSAVPPPVATMNTPASIAACLDRFRGHWILVAFGESRAVATHVQSAWRQFRARGLTAVIAIAGASENLKYDWALSGVNLLSDCTDRTTSPSLMLISPDGKTTWTYNGLAPPGELGLALRSFLGSPLYAQMDLP